MLNFTRKIDYALVAMMHLGMQPAGQATSAREIASQYNMPLPLLMNILKDLCSGGLIDSTRGARGGYRLAKPADQIRLVDVMEAAEGPVRLTECSNGLPVIGRCGVSEAGCPIRRPIQQLHRRIVKMLADTTLGGMLGEEATERRSDGATEGGGRRHEGT